MTEIKKTKRKVMTNYYLTYNGTDVLFDTIVTGETVVFCIQENNIYRVFYYSVDEKDLIENLKRLPQNSILDIVAQEGRLDVQWLEGAEFYLYSTYARFGQPLLHYEKQKELMSKNRIDAFYNEEYGECATADVLYSMEKKSLLNAIKEYGVSYAYSWIALTNKKALKRSDFPADHMRNYIFEKKELDL